jgi:DNA-binding transcriptional LysR family regulator
VVGFFSKEIIMSLTKSVVIDQITVTENGIVLFREATRILEDGVELSKTYHRSSLTPGQDLSGVPANVQAICNAAWTPEVVATFQAAQAANVR